MKSGFRLIVFFCCFILSFNIAEAKRIVSLAPSITEVLFLLELDDQLVGVTANCDYPALAKQIEKIGFFGSPNIEKIIKLKPDLVLATDFGPQAYLAKLAEVKIPVQVLPAQNMTEVMESIKTIGGLTDKQKAANILVNNMQARLKTIATKVAGQAKPAVLVVVWVNPNVIMTVGARSFLNELIALAGGTNIAGQLEVGYPMISPEFILASDPEVIILGVSMGNKIIIDNLLALPGIEETRAVKSKRIHLEEKADLFFRPGPRLINGLEEIARILHPNVFTVKGDELNGKT